VAHSSHTINFAGAREILFQNWSCRRGC